MHTLLAVWHAVNEASGVIYVCNPKSKLMLLNWMDGVFLRAGMRMDANIEELLRRWTSAIRRSAR